MSQPRKRQPRRITEHEEAAHEAGYSEGFDAGYDAGREQAMFDKGHELGYHEGFAEASCQAYDAGYKDAKAGKPPQHQPHRIPDDGDPHNNDLDNLELDESHD
jgi:hypothetical protein